MFCIKLPSQRSGVRKVAEDFPLTRAPLQLLRDADFLEDFLARHGGDVSHSPLSFANRSFNASSDSEARLIVPLCSVLSCNMPRCRLSNSSAFTRSLSLIFVRRTCFRS